MKLCITLLFLIISVVARHKKGKHHNYHRPHFSRHYQIVPWKSIAESENAMRRDYLNENPIRRNKLGFLNNFDDFDINSFIRHAIEEKLEKNVDGDQNRINFFNLKQKVSKKGRNNNFKRKQHRNEVEMNFEDPELYADDTDLQEKESSNLDAPSKNLKPGKSKMHRNLPSNKVNAFYKDSVQQKGHVKLPEGMQENVPGSKVNVKLAIGPDNLLGPVPIATIFTDDESGSGSENINSVENNSGELPEAEETGDTGQNVPQETSNQIQATHTNTAIGQTYPNFPVPPMIPIPLFYNSGDTEGSGASGMNDVKPSNDITEGESGYGEEMQNSYSSGDWVERAINKKNYHDGDEDGGVDDEEDEEERWMKRKSKKRKLNNLPLMNSPLQNTQYQKQENQQRQQEQQRQQRQQLLLQQQQKQRQEGRNQFQQQQYYAGYSSQTYVNPYSQQQYNGYYQVPLQTFTPQDQYSQQQINRPSQTYSESKPNEQTSKPQEPFSSAAAVSAVSASSEQKVSKTWENQAAPIGVSQQGSYILTELPAVVEPSVSQDATSLKDSYQTSPDLLSGECAATCPATCAPSCDAECCSRGYVGNIQGATEQVLEAPVKQTSQMPEFNNIIAATNLVAQQPVPDVSSNSPIVTQISYQNEQQLDSLLPGATLQLPDVTIGPNEATQSAPVPSPKTEINTAIFPQSVINQAYSQPDTIISNAQTLSATEAGRFDVENNPPAAMSVQQTFSSQQYFQQVPGNTNMFQNIPLTVRNFPSPLPKKFVNIRPFDAPPPVPVYRNPMPADVNSPAAATPQGIEMKNFALKPIQPILLKVPSIVHPKKEGSEIRYPSPQCMKICEVKCLPFCQNNCCRIPAERKKKRSKINRF